MMRGIPRSIWLAAAFSVALALIVAFDLTPWIRGGYGWRWHYDPAAGGRVLVLIGVVVAYLGVGIALMRRSRIWPLLVWGVIGTVSISYVTVLAHTGDAFQTMLGRTLDFTTTGQHEAAAQIDWAGGEWKDWAGYMRGTDGHIALAPPGSVLWYGLLDASLATVPPLADSLRVPLLAAQCHNYAYIGYTPAEQASAWFGVLMPLWAGLTVLPLYAIARRMTDAQGAGWAVLWWAMVPGVAGFAASWNTMYPLLAALAFWALLRGLDAAHGRNMAAWCGLAGLFAGLAVFTNFAFMPLPVVMGVYTLLRYWFNERETRPLQRPVIVGAYAVLGAIIPWLLFFIPTGQTLFDMLQAALDYHFDLDRPYWFWVGMHLWDFLLWAGAGLAGIGLLALWQWRGRRDGPLLMLALTITLLVFAFSGTARGETGRVWLFLAPLLLVAAADAVRRLTDAALAGRAFAMMTFSHALLTVALVAAVPVMPDPLTRPADLMTVIPNVSLSSGTGEIARFANGNETLFRLDAFNAVHTDEDIELALAWQGINRPEAAYWFGAFLVGPDGITTEPVLWQPRESFGREMRYPTTCWGDGVRVEDQIALPLPDGAEPGDWWVSLAVFGDAANPEGRLNVTLPDGSGDVQVGLGPVNVR